MVPETAALSEPAHLLWRRTVQAEEKGKVDIIPSLSGAGDHEVPPHGGSWECHSQTGNPSSASTCTSCTGRFHLDYVQMSPRGNPGAPGSFYHRGITLFWRRSDCSRFGLSLKGNVLWKSKRGSVWDILFSEHSLQHKAVIHGFKRHSLQSQGWSWVWCLTPPSEVWLLCKINFLCPCLGLKRLF